MHMNMLPSSIHPIKVGLCQDRVSWTSNDCPVCHETYVGGITLSNTEIVGNKENGVFVLFLKIRQGV